MEFFQRLEQATLNERHYLQQSSIITAALTGQATREQYLAFLTQAYYHVSQTVPLLMACGARVPANMEWLRTEVANYIAEELGHQEWILSDIVQAGGQADVVRNGKPLLATELMIAYAWDVVQRQNPLAFFGMVYVLEGTSIQLACQVADALKASLSLPEQAFTYLMSHGALDQQHMHGFRLLVNRFENPLDQDAVIHAAQVFFRLYGNVIRSVDFGVKES